MKPIKVTVELNNNEDNSFMNELVNNLIDFEFAKILLAHDKTLHDKYFPRNVKHKIVIHNNYGADNNKPNILIGKDFLNDNEILRCKIDLKTQEYISKAYSVLLERSSSKKVPLK